MTNPENYPLTKHIKMHCNQPKYKKYFLAVSSGLFLSISAIYLFIDMKYFEAILIVVGVIITFLFQKRSILITLIPIVCGTIFITNPLPAFKKIYTSNLALFSHLSTNFANIYTPGTGLNGEVLDRPILHMLNMIQDNNLPNYRLSNALDSVNQIKYSIVESAWPIKLEKTSKYVFFEDTEQSDYSYCSPIENRQEIILAICP